MRVITAAQAVSSFYQRCIGRISSISAVSARVLPHASAGGSWGKGDGEGKGEGKESGVSITSEPIAAGGGKHFTYPKPSILSPVAKWVLFGQAGGRGTGKG